MSNLLGSHIPKGTLIAETIKLCVYRYGVRPYQLFLQSPYGKQGKYDPEDLKKSLEFISSLHLPVFVHSPYIINLSDPWTKKDVNKCSPWILNLLRSDLQICNQIGGSGVVVHVGKKKNMPLEQALNQMEQSIRQVLPCATEKCPLLLETPAGEGTELCSSIDQLSNFYNRFSNDDKKIFKICIDTCHVFASDHDPLQYLEDWTNLHGINSIKLIHLNDSKKPKGSRVDRHAYIGNGFIGLDQMNQIIEWAIKNNVPMVIE